MNYTFNMLTFQIPLFLQLRLFQTIETPSDLVSSVHEAAPEPCLSTDCLHSPVLKFLKAAAKTFFSPGGLVAAGTLT